MTGTDLIIIGAGPGGYRAAEYAAKNGLKVIVFDGKDAGGTCLNCGCIPTKTLARNADVMHALSEAEVFGLNNLQYEFDFSRVMARKDEVVSTLRNGVEALLKMPGITFVNENVTFVDSKTVRTLHSGDEYTAPNIIIATGSSNKMLRLKEFDTSLLDEGVVCDSTELLSTKTLPGHLCIVGAGVIGMEFASIYRSFGCEVTVIEFLKECLPAVDSEISKRLRKSLEKRGVNFMMQSGVTSITRDGVFYERKGKSACVSADKILIAVGRKPNISDDFANAGIEFDERTGIKVDDDMQTNVPGIYAIGDVNCRQMLAHAATMQGLRAVNTILKRKDNIRLDIMPAAVFTYPEVGCVGPTEDLLKDKGISYKVYKSRYHANGKALAMNETEGLVKLLTDADDHILGCHILGAHASDLIQEVVAWMNQNGTIQQLRECVHIHPTLSEVLQDLA